MQKTILTSVVLGAIAVIFSSFLISQTDFKIKTDNATTAGGQLTNTISVSGDGKVFAAPDMMEIRLSVSEIAPTTAAAQEKVSQKINQILELLQGQGVDKKNIQTAQISINPEYDYSESGRKLKGQRARQTLSIKVKNISLENEKSARIIDQVAAIDEIEINSIQFDIEDKTEFYSAARKLAFEKAEQKAKELASLGDLKLQKPVSISDTSFDVSSSPTLNANFAMEEKAGGLGASSSIPSGELELSVNLNVVWGVK